MRSRDLENLVSRYGRGANYHTLRYLSDDGLTVSGNRFRRVQGVELKHDFAFIEFSDPRDADDARYNLDGRQFDGSRIVVEFAKGGPHGSGGSREYLGRGPPPGSGRCFNCGIDGHWARDCKAGDWKNRCYCCGERGHIERNCRNSPKNLKPGRSYSRSLSRSPACRCRSQSWGRGYSPSRSPPRRERSVDRERSQSSPYSRSPEPKSSPFKRARSPSPQDGSPRERGGPPMDPRHDAPHDGSEYSGSPGGNGRSPSVGRDGPDGRYRSPETNGRSPSLRDNGTPVEDVDDNRGYPRGSCSLSGSQD